MIKTTATDTGQPIALGCETGNSAFEQTWAAIEAIKDERTRRKNAHHVAQKKHGYILNQLRLEAIQAQIIRRKSEWENAPVQNDIVRNKNGNVLNPVYHY